MKCKVCGDSGEIIRFTSAGYDHPPVQVKVVCPECRKGVPVFQMPAPPRGYVNVIVAAITALAMLPSPAAADQMPDGGYALTLPDGGTPAPAVPAWRALLELEPDAGFTLELTDVVVLPGERAIALGGERRFYREKNRELQRTPPVLVSSEFWWWVLGFSLTAAVAAGSFAWWLYGQLPSR